MKDKGVCFSRQVRLLKAAEFSRVFKKPVRSSDRYLTILAISRKPENADSNIIDSDLQDLQKTEPVLTEQAKMVTARLGLAISKKNAKRAVDRNRIKRIIRESFRLNLQTLPPIDLVVMAKPVTKNADNQQIFHSLEQHWNKLRQNFELDNQPARATDKLQSRNLQK